MAVSNEEIQQWFQANPNASDADVYNVMQTYGVDTSQLSNAMNFNPEEVQSRYQAQQASFAPEVASEAPAAAPTASPDEQILSFVQANINNPALIAETAAQYGVSVADLSRVTGYDANDVVNYFQQANVAPPNYEPTFTGGLPKPYTDVNYSTPATPPPTIYDPELADRSFSDFTPASKEIASSTPQAATTSIPPSAPSLTDPFAGLSGDQIKALTKQNSQFVRELVESYGKSTPASMGIEDSTSQATTPAPNKPPAPSGGLKMVGESASAPAVGGLKSVENAKYTQYTDQGVTDWLKDFVTQNLPTYYEGNVFEGAQQLKDALTKSNADPDQIRRILKSGATVPTYGGAKAGGTDINLSDFIDEFEMATSKTPMTNALGKLTLDPAQAAQAAQNELDTLFDPNKGSLMPIKNADFELGGKYYGRIGERDKLIADYYNDPANKAKIDAAQKAVFDKYGVPTDMRLAPRAISQNLARTEVKPAAAVDPNDYQTYEDYSAAQNAASLRAFQDKAATYKKYGIDIMAKEDPQQRHPSSGQVSLANLKAGLAGRDPQAAANFYGMTLENYNNLKSGNKTKPMGQFADVYGTQLLSPVEQIAAQTARGQGIGTMSPQTAALAKKYPEIFNKASQKYNNYFTTKFPQTLEYESVLSGPMQYSSTGVTAPKITGTSSMYTIDPKTRKIVKNPSYKPKGGLSSVGKK